MISKLPKNDLIIGIVGSGGDGVVAAGELLTWAAASEGLFSFMLKSFGSQVRGGESSCTIRMSESPVLSQGDKLDVLVAFNWADYAKFKSELEIRQGTIVLCEANDPTPADDIPLPLSTGPTIHKIPFRDLAKAQTGRELGKNIVMLGVLAEVFGLPADAIRHALRGKFERKGSNVVEMNLRAFDAGTKYVREEIQRPADLRFSYQESAPKMVMSGNEAIALGALAAQIEVFAGYPITPASEIMEYLARLMPLYDRVWVQAEDEIASLGIALGASFAGKKAMTTTSGPGLSLMNELIGLASIAELPVVIVDVQRAGPSTGMPTKSEQADLQQALYGSHGDAPRVVLAPADVEDCFQVTMEAFCIAEEYQTPVIILSDQFIGQRKESVPRFTLDRVKTCGRRLPAPPELQNFRRYVLSTTGISPMSLPGMKDGEYTAAGIEHDEYGNPTSSADIHEQMNAKRFRKLEAVRHRRKFVRRYGSPDAEVGVIGWGSSKGVIKEAVLTAEAEGVNVSGIVPQLLYPLPLEELQAALEPLRKLIVVEMSYSGQFLKHLRAHLELPDEVVSLNRSGGKPFAVNEILERIEQEVGYCVYS